MSKLYVVGTPIGNLGDITARAAKTLGEVDFIAAEDTRVSIKLLNHLGIKKPLISYHEHSRSERDDEIIARLHAGESCALVSDAGMPVISDPGEQLVRRCREEGIEVESVPGPTAFATAIAISGMCAGRFTFEGFLSANKNSRAEHLKSLVTERRTMVFYEAPHKIRATLKDMYALLGDREIAICRELTKIHEQVIRTTLSAASRMYEQGRPMGEFVIIVAGASEQQLEDEYTVEQAVQLARRMMEDGMSLSDASREAAAASGIKKNIIYKQLLD